MLRNSVLISIDSERQSSAESSSVAEKDDSRCSQVTYRGSLPYAIFISANCISANFISAIFQNFQDISCLNKPFLS